jgi:DNA-binding NarL/FixJ family response regulator
MGSKVRILLVDDHPVVRAGLAITLGKVPEFEICGEAEGVRDALDMIRKLLPALVIVDLDLDGDSGLELIRATNQIDATLPVLVLSMHDEEIYAERVLRAGGRGYLMKSQSTKHLIEAIKLVLDGGIAVSESLKNSAVKRLVKGDHDQEAGTLKSLSDRELEVFRLIGIGTGTRKIAETLCLSVKTVETHVSHIKRKLHLQTATEVQQRAFQFSQGFK